MTPVPSFNLFTRRAPRGDIPDSPQSSKAVASVVDTIHLPTQITYTPVPTCSYAKRI